MVVLLTGACATRDTPDDAWVFRTGPQGTRQFMDDWNESGPITPETAYGLGNLIGLTVLGIARLVAR